MTNHPEIVVGMPVFNGEDLIAAAIDSLLNQKFSDFEIHISDNASTDKTSEIALDYCKRDKWVKYHRNRENIGAVNNFRRLLEISRGKYFMWAAVDDRWHADYLGEAHSMLERNPRYSLAFSAFETIEFNSGKTGEALVGFSNSESRSARTLTRLLNPCANLVYGLQRLDVAKTLEIHPVDYWDILWALQHELKGGILTSPHSLHVCGSRSKRKPYSITHDKITASGFIVEQAKLFARNLPMHHAAILILLGTALIVRSSRSARR